MAVKKTSAKDLAAKAAAAKVAAEEKKDDVVKTVKTVAKKDETKVEAPKKEVVAEVKAEPKRRL